MSAPVVAELAFLSYCDVSYAGARACVEALEWHRARGHTVVSQPLGVITQCGSPSVSHPQCPAASDTLSTVSIGTRVVASYAIIHCALLRAHAASNAAAIVAALSQRGARRIFLLSSVHQPLFSGLRCQVCQFVCRIHHRVHLHKHHRGNTTNTHVFIYLPQRTCVYLLRVPRRHSAGIPSAPQPCARRHALKPLAVPVWAALRAATL